MSLRAAQSNFILPPHHASLLSASGFATSSSGYPPSSSGSDFAPDFHGKFLRDFHVSSSTPGGDHDAPPTAAQPPGEPLQGGVVALIAVLLAAMASAVLGLLWRCVARRRKRRRQMDAVAPDQAAEPWRRGVRADQPVAFAVPTTVAVPETTASTTDDSFSEAGYSSGGWPSRSRRRDQYHIDPEELERGLYAGVRAAGAETAGGEGGGGGRIGFRLAYSASRHQLSLTLIGAEDLNATTVVGPYVKVVLLPDRATKYATRAPRRKCASDPVVFEETFWFGVRREALDHKALRVSLWERDRFSRKRPLGQLLYAVRDSGLSGRADQAGATGDLWLRLDRPRGGSGGGAELLLSLSLDASELTLTLLEARGLPPPIHVNSAVYAKIALHVRGRPTRTHKTTPRPRATPSASTVVLGDALFQAPSAPADLSLVVALCERCGGSKRVLGRIRLGREALLSPGERWLALSG